MHPLDSATFIPVTEPPPGATLHGVQVRLLTPDPHRPSDFPRGPFKLLTGDDPVTVRPLSGVAIAYRYECGGNLDQLHGAEFDADLSPLDGDQQPRRTLLDRVLRRLDSYGTGIDYAPTIAALLATHADKPEARLDRGEGGHDQAVRLALRHAPDADIVVVNANGRNLTFWNYAKHFIRSLLALRWIRSGAKDARGGEEAQ